MSDAAVTVEAASVTSADGWEWALVEVFGHRSHAGRCREEEKFGAKMLRVDVPILTEGSAPPMIVNVERWETHYYGGSSIFCFTPTDEDSVMRANAPSRRSAPMPYQLPAPSHSHCFDGEED